MKIHFGEEEEEAEEEEEERRKIAVKTKIPEWQLTTLQTLFQNPTRHLYALQISCLSLSLFLSRTLSLHVFVSVSVSLPSVCASRCLFSPLTKVFI